ncbi:MAG: carbohydrate ABC transporter permease, partial [Christensenellales bacterium]
PEDSINWLHDPNIIIFSIILIGFPWIGGTSTLIYASGLMNISNQVIEASKLDGASTFRRIVSIDLPLLSGQIRYFLIFGIIGGFQDYGTQFTLTNGGPGYSTYVPGWYMYKLAFTDDRMGYASAISAVLFLAILIVTAICFKYLSIPGLSNKDKE